jgi:hypothetical protein
MAMVKDFRGVKNISSWFICLFLDVETAAHNLVRVGFACLVIKEGFNSVKNSDFLDCYLVPYTDI